MNLLRRLDGALFDYVFQPLVNRLRGASTVEIARFLLCGIMLGLIAEAVIRYRTHSLYAMDAISGGILLPILLWAYWTGGQRTSRGGARNAERISPVALMCRTCMVLAFAVGLMGIILRVDLLHCVAMAVDTLFVAEVYIVACDDPPPPSRRSAGVLQTASVRT